MSTTTMHPDEQGPAPRRRVDKRVLIGAAVAVLVLAFVVPFVRRQWLARLGVTLDELPLA